MTDMSNTVAHFSINADDTSRASRFYENVFGWKFQAWGPPGFYMIEMQPATVALRGSLQQRRELVPGVAMRGFECTISVADARATADAVQKNGGEIVMQLCTLAGIGQLFFFRDTEGNLVGAMQYETEAK